MSAQMPGEPTEEELQQAFAQMREAPVQEVLMQAISVLATGAEVKLGRPDARPLIDSVEALVKIAGPMMGEVTEQLQQAVVQLKTFQVQAEKEAAGEGEGGPEAPAAEAGQPADAPPQAASPQAASPQAAPGAGEQKQTDKLWIPGRDG